jgi:hypothetical protein
MDPGFAVALRSVLAEQVRDSRPAARGPRRRLAKGLTAGLVIVGQRPALPWHRIGSGRLSAGPKVAK